MIWFFVSLAGGCGAVSRALVDRWFAKDRPAWHATLTVNLLGSFAIGVASGLLPADWFLVVGTGFLGGFTTFSSSAWQVAREWGRRDFRLALGYGAATLIGCVALALLGRILATGIL